MSFKDYLKSKNACDEALEWVGERTLEQAWAECKRGDWMLWLAAKSSVDRKLITLAICDCVQTAWKYCDEEALAALKLCDHVIHEWCEDRASIADVRAVRSTIASALETKTTDDYIPADVAADVACTYAMEAADTACAYVINAAYAAYGTYGIDAVDDAAEAARDGARMDCASLIRARIPVALLTLTQEEE